MSFLLFAAAKWILEGAVVGAVDIVRNKTTIYTKKDELDTHFLKTDIVAECSAYEIESDVLEEIRKKGELIQEFKYTT